MFIQGICIAVNPVIRRLDRILLITSPLIFWENTSWVRGVIQFGSAPELGVIRIKFYLDDYLDNILFE
jgi:hypothetical protein